MATALHGEAWIVPTRGPCASEPATSRSSRDPGPTRCAITSTRHVHHRAARQSADHHGGSLMSTGRPASVSTRTPSPGAAAGHLPAAQRSSQTGPIRPAAEVSGGCSPPFPGWHEFRASTSARPSCPSSPRARGGRAGHRCADACSTWPSSPPFALVRADRRRQRPGGTRPRRSARRPCLRAITTTPPDVDRGGPRRLGRGSRAAFAQTVTALIGQATDDVRRALAHRPAADLSATTDASIESSPGRSATPRLRAHGRVQAHPRHTPRQHRIRRRPRDRR